jgi:hypothetical protein
MNAIAKAVYSGTLIRDLENAAERLLRHNSIPCECGYALGEHSHEGRHCPNMAQFGALYLARTFRELRCEATVLSGLDPAGERCGKAVLPGKRMCEEHAENVS